MAHPFGLNFLVKSRRELQRDIGSQGNARKEWGTGSIPAPSLFCLSLLGRSSLVSPKNEVGFERRDKHSGTREHASGWVRARDWTGPSEFVQALQ